MGGDPYLNVLRASLSSVGGDLEEARDFANRAIKEEPTLVQAYFHSCSFGPGEEIQGKLGDAQKARSDVPR